MGAQHCCLRWSAVVDRLSCGTWIYRLGSAKKRYMKENRLKSVRGFTLIELMITLVIAAIVLTFAIPSFQTVFQNNRLATQANELVTAMNLARSEAIKTGQPVSVCASSNGTACVGTWVQGWRVFNAAGTIRVFTAMNDMAANSGGVTTLVFSGQGAKAIPNGVVSFVLTPQGCISGTVNRMRTISISNTGRANVSTGNCP